MHGSDELEKVELLCITHEELSVWSSYYVESDAYSSILYSALDLLCWQSARTLWSFSLRSSLYLEGKI